MEPPALMTVPETKPKTKRRYRTNESDACINRSFYSIPSYFNTLFIFNISIAVYFIKQNPLSNGCRIKYAQIIMESILITVRPFPAGSHINNIMKDLRSYLFNGLFPCCDLSG